jgi:hypothetical protein
LTNHRAGEERSGGEVHPASPGGKRGIDSFVDWRGIELFAVAGGAVFGDIKGAGGGVGGERAGNEVKRK